MCVQVSACTKLSCVCACVGVGVGMGVCVCKEKGRLLYILVNKYPFQYPDFKMFCVNTSPQLFSKEV